MRLINFHAMSRWARKAQYVFARCQLRDLYIESEVQKKIAGMWTLFLSPFEELAVGVALGHPKGRVSGHTSGQR